MTSRAGPLWWTLARSEEVTDKKPLAVNIGDQLVVLWRDTQGIVRALEDRCPTVARRSRSGASGTMLDSVRLSWLEL